MCLIRGFDFRGGGGLLVHKAGASYTRVRPIREYVGYAKCLPH